MPLRLFISTVFAIVICGGSLAQTCPTGQQSGKLICQIPQVYGVDGLAAAVSYGDSGVFSANFLVQSLAPLESSIARQSAQLPLASPSAGLTYAWDPATRVFVSSTQSFGPIFGERAETIGRHKLFVGFSYQYFNFDQINGISLKHLPVTLSQPDDRTSFANDNTHAVCSASSNNDIKRSNGTLAFSSLTDCGYIRDLIETTNQISLKVHQVTTYVTFGITNRIDVSVAVPAENVRMAVTSTATIFYNDDRAQKRYYAFDPTRPDCVNHLNINGQCLTSTFTSSANASGIGDVTLRAKGTAWKGERTAVGVGVDVRLPTGDQLNFLGAGTAGIRPFAIWSYSARVSPHVLVDTRQMEVRLLAAT